MPPGNAAGHRLNLVPFMDYGAAWNHGKMADYLCAVGLGFQWALDRARTEFYWAYPIIPQATRRWDTPQDQGIFFQVWLDAL